MLQKRKHQKSIGDSYKSMQTYLICILGTISSPEDFKKYILKDDGGPHCGICKQFYNRSITNVKNHIESKHFPNSFLYSCNMCFINVNSKKALERHTTRCKASFGNK